MPDSLSDDRRRMYEEELHDLKLQVETLTRSIEGLVEAWNTAKGVTSFVKWLSGIITAGAIIYATMTGKK